MHNHRLIRDHSTTQAPLPALLALVTEIGGLALGVSTITSLVNEASEYLNALEGPLSVVALLRYLYKVAPTACGLLLLAVSRIMGGAIGLVRVWEALLLQRSRTLDGGERQRGRS